MNSNKAVTPTEKKIARYVRQIEAFVASPLVEQFLVGITAREATRRASYEREGFEYFLILDTGLAHAKALELEKVLFNHLDSDESLCLKYHGEKKGKGYKGSSGGATGEAYCLYIAAFAP